MVRHYAGRYSQRGSTEHFLLFTRLSVPVPAQDPATAALSSQCCVSHQTSQRQSAMARARRSILSISPQRLSVSNLFVDCGLHKWAQSCPSSILLKSSSLGVLQVNGFIVGAISFGLYGLMSLAFIGLSAFAGGRFKLEEMPNNL